MLALGLCVPVLVFLVYLLYEFKVNILKIFYWKIQKFLEDITDKIDQFFILFVFDRFEQ